MIKLSYKKRIFAYFFLVFLIFTISIIFYEQKRERELLTKSLEQRLETYVEFINAYIQKGEDESRNERAAKITSLLPDEARVSIISRSGELIYDNQLQNVQGMGNHLLRPEIEEADRELRGRSIRVSTTTGVEYLYYAHKFDNCFVRVALPYVSHAKRLLNPTPEFLFFVSVLFVLVLFFFLIVSDQFGKSISNLKIFATAIKSGQRLPENISFPNDELGHIGSELVEIFNQKEQNKERIELEKEKLLRHMRFSQNGIAIYSPEKESIYFNSYFILFVNLISKNSISHADEFFDLAEFNAIAKFLKNKTKKENHFSCKIKGNGKVMNLHTVVYEDQSFEVVMRDITKEFKNQQLKQEMTNNIAHELRTPVTSIRGYLETLLYNEGLSLERHEQFLQKAYNQSIRLSSLIDDVSLLSKIAESSSYFKFENLDLLAIIKEVRASYSDSLMENKIKLFVDIDKSIPIMGNRTLLQSIFSNLIDNSIKYAGKETEIHISKYLEDKKFVSLSYYDTGKGVEERHLNRLFERFYRVDEGRSSETGGTGLGLAIVRNAVLAHKGVLRVKNREGAGLEFLFTLKKTREAV